MEKVFFEKISDGLVLSSHPKVLEAAQRFMRDNGFSYSIQGRTVAESHVAQWCENNNAPADFSAAIRAAILTCPEPLTVGQALDGIISELKA